MFRSVSILSALALYIDVRLPRLIFETSTECMAKPRLHDAPTSDIQHGLGFIGFPDSTAFTI